MAQVNGIEQDIELIVSELAKEPPAEAYNSMPRDDKKTGERNEIEFLPIEYVIKRMQEIFGIRGFSIWCDNPIFSAGEQWVYVPVEISFSLPDLFPRPLRGIGTFTNTGVGTFIQPDHAVQTARSLGIKEIMRIFPAFGFLDDDSDKPARASRKTDDDYGTVKLRRTVNRGKPDEAQVEMTVAEWAEKDRSYLVWTLSARDPKFSEFQATLKYAVDKDIQLIRDALMQRKVEDVNKTILETTLKGVVSLPQDQASAQPGASEGQSRANGKRTGNRIIESLRVDVNYTLGTITLDGGASLGFGDLVPLANREKLIEAGAKELGMARVREEMRVLYGLDVARNLEGMTMIQYTEYRHYLTDRKTFQPLVTEDWDMDMLEVIRRMREGAAA